MPQLNKEDDDMISRSEARRYAASGDLKLATLASEYLRLSIAADGAPRDAAAATYRRRDAIGREIRQHLVDLDVEGKLEELAELADLVDETIQEIKELQRAVRS